MCHIRTKNIFINRLHTGVYMWLYIARNVWQKLTLFSLEHIWYCLASKHNCIWRKIIQVYKLYLFSRGITDYHFHHPYKANWLGKPTRLFSWTWTVIEFCWKWRGHANRYAKLLVVNVMVGLDSKIFLLKYTGNVGEMFGSIKLSCLSYS